MSLLDGKKGGSSSKAVQGLVLLINPEAWRVLRRADVREAKGPAVLDLNF